MLAQLVFWPYADEKLNLFEFISLFVSFIEFYLGLYLTIPDVSSGGQTIFGVLMVFFASLFVAFSVIFFFYGIYVSRQARAATEAALARGDLVFDDDADEDEAGDKIIDPQSEKLVQLGQLDWRNSDDSAEASVAKLRNELDAEKLKQEKILNEVLGKKADRLKRISESVALHGADFAAAKVADATASTESARDAIASANAAVDGSDQAQPIQDTSGGGNGLTLRDRESDTDSYAGASSFEAHVHVPVQLEAMREDAASLATPHVALEVALAAGAIRIRLA